MGPRHHAGDQLARHHFPDAGADGALREPAPDVRCSVRLRRDSLGFAAAACGAWIVLLYLVLPLLFVVPVSLTPQRYLSLPDRELSLRHYATLIDDPSWINSILHSAIVASSATLIAVLMGTLTAIGCWRIASRLSEVARIIMLAPMIVPPIVHALGFYRVWVRFGLIDTFPGLILAHGIKGMPFVLITVAAALANFDLRLEQAARNLGASLAQTVRLVLLPCILPGIATGAVFAFIISWDEIVVTLFITSRHVYTLPRKIWDGIADNINPSVAAVATIFILITLVLLALSFLLRREARVERSAA
ncbi:MAG: ABC transporter permease [Proteobacteria bacterium]|nr:ABC transporter permease [Pseudomonadota bacterium]